MKLRFPAIVILCCLCATGAYAEDEDTHDAPRPGMITRFLNIFRGSPDRIQQPRKINWKQLVLSMSVDPQVVKLGENRQIKVILQLTNNSKKFIQLEFPTTQRIEVLMKDRNGKLVEQWSEDQSFANEPSLVVLNPRERLEYTASVATRDMNSGQPYTIEAFFPNYEKLKIHQTVVPQK